MNRAERWSGKQLGKQNGSVDERGGKQCSASERERGKYEKMEAELARTMIPLSHNDTRHCGFIFNGTTSVYLSGSITKCELSKGPVQENMCF